MAKVLTANGANQEELEDGQYSSATLATQPVGHTCAIILHYSFTLECCIESGTWWYFEFISMQYCNVGDPSWEQVLKTKRCKTLLCIANSG